MGSKYYENKEKGLCVQCGHENNNGRFTCNKCLEKQNKAYISLRDKRIKHGLCVKCGTNLTYRDKKKNGKMYRSCYKCRDYRKKYLKIMEEKNE